MAELPNTLVSWSTPYSGEGIGRIVSANCTTYTVRGVDFGDDGEFSTGQVATVHKHLCHPIPSPAEIAERATVERDEALSVLAARYGGKHERPPQIREYEATLLHAPRHVG